MMEDEITEEDDLELYRRQISFIKSTTTALKLFTNLESIALSYSHFHIDDKFFCHSLSFALDVLHRCSECVNKRKTKRFIE